jgi:hypothetical protein
MIINKEVVMSAQCPRNARPPRVRSSAVPGAHPDSAALADVAAPLASQRARRWLVGAGVLTLLTGGAAVGAEPPFRGPPPPGLSPGDDPPLRPVPIEAFYDVLRDYGTFIDSDRYGVLFCPHPDAVGADFQPYLHGHWVMSEAGWTFTSDLKISWVTDHYGRWVEAGLQNCNWAWVPGGQWGPAWVDFRVGEKVIAWRPQPYTGPRVTLRRPEATSFPHFVLPPANYTSDSGYVAVRDGEFLSRRLDYVALTGLQLYNALRDSEPLRNLRAGLNSEERDRIIARLIERKATQGISSSAAASASSSSKPGSGGATPDAFEPAQRRRKPGSGGVPASTPGGVAGAAGTVRTGVAGSDGNKGGGSAGNEKNRLNLTGAQPGQTPPDRTNMTSGSSAGSPGEFSGIKIPTDLPAKPKQPLKLSVPKPPPPDPNERNLNPDTSPLKK